MRHPRSTSPVRTPVSEPVGIRLSGDDGRARAQLIAHEGVHIFQAKPGNGSSPLNWQCRHKRKRPDRQKNLRFRRTELRQFLLARSRQPLTWKPRSVRTPSSHLEPLD
jgi:hypothetical protein